VGATRRVLARRVIFFATVVCAFAGVADVAINWSNSRRSVDPGKPLSSAPSSSPNPRAGPDPPPVPSPAPQPTAPVPPRGTGDAEEPSPPPHRDHQALPLDFTLRDGEQRPFLGDQASVAAEFNQIGSEDFVTLRVSTTEGESVPHAVLGTGPPFSVRVAGREYSVYVLSVDKTARTIKVRISRNSESHEKRGQ
jgi:hypothetical protein